jgi:hypothetical protein
MKRFHCPNCANELYFDSTTCVDCGNPVGYDPLEAEMRLLRVDATASAPATMDEFNRHLCANAVHEACNWLATSADAHGRCLSCRHNRTIPDLSQPSNLTGWRVLETAKRHMFYSLLRWQLPMPTRAEDPASGLAFDVLADYTGSDGKVERVLTGHDAGLITLNIAEADDPKREKMRTDMHEPYRTLLGHFRHEIGHYYWDRLVRDRGNTAAFRQAFGNETADYDAALKKNYEQGPATDWQAQYISAYASLHPWEDFAETWAHYMHIIDSLETARAYMMTIGRSSGGTGATEIGLAPYETTKIETILNIWVPFTLALNNINRSMGQHDFYPFVISPPVVEKLTFIHRLVHQRE